MFSMVTISHVIIMVTKIWIEDIMQGNMLEDSITSYDVGDVRHIVAHCHHEML
jgi:hypothetical protein